MCDIWFSFTALLMYGVNLLVAVWSSLGVFASLLFYCLGQGFVRGTAVRLSDILELSWPLSCPMDCLVGGFEDTDLYSAAYAWINDLLSCSLYYPLLSLIYCTTRSEIVFHHGQHLVLDPGWSIAWVWEEDCQLQVPIIHPCWWSLLLAHIHEFMVCIPDFGSRIYDDCPRSIWDHCCLYAGKGLWWINALLQGLWSSFSVVKGCSNCCCCLCGLYIDHHVLKLAICFDESRRT